MIVKKSILIDDDIIYYILDKGKRKRMKMQITGNTLIVKTPQRKTMKSVESFIKSNYQWVKKNILKPTNIKAPLDYIPDETIFIYGEPYKIKVLKGSSSYVHIKSKYLYVYIGRAKVKTVIEKYLNESLYNYISDKIAELSVVTGLVPNSFSLRKLNSTWGIASSDKHITFNKQLVYYPKEAIDYIILHELCHLKVMSHSNEFWDLVFYYMPDFNRRQDFLK